MTDQGQNFTAGRLFANRYCFLAMLVLLTGFLLRSAQAVTAQVTDGVLVQPPNIENFPLVSAEFKLLDGSDGVNLDLLPEQLTVLEDGQQVVITSLETIYRGVHFTLAVEGGRELDLHDTNGVSTFEKVRTQLIDWGERTTLQAYDSWSLIIENGSRIRNTRTTDQWMVALRDYQPDFRRIEPSLANFEIALQLTRERVVPFGVDKVLLYITPPPAPNDIERIDALAEIARQEGIRVNVWMVGDGYFLTNQQGGSLVAIAETTGGQFFHFTGVEKLPDPNTYLAQLGVTHILVYESQVRQTGTYSLRIEVNHQDRQISGESVPFYIDLQPPNPVLITPPVKITRSVMAKSEDFEDTLEPSNFLMQFLVEFPDGHPRDLVASRLVIDDVIVDVRDAPPFDKLNWDLTSLTETGTHTILVEVDDSLGFSGKTILTPVQVELVMSEADNTLPTGQIGLVIAGLVVGASLITLSVWLFRRRWKPVLPLEVASEVFGTGWIAGSDHHVIMEPERKPFAVLHGLGNLSANTEEPMTPIDHSPATFGRDPNRASLLIDKKGVDGLQAKLWRHNGAIWLVDLGSEKGTWVNYELVGTEPVQIQSGDLIHFGDVGFRFTINHSPMTKKITISEYEPIL